MSPKSSAKHSVTAPRRPGEPRHGFVQRLRTFFQTGVYELGSEEPLSPWKAGLVRILRVGLIAGRGFVRDNCLMRAGSLTYVTIFSLVPLLAVSFAVAKGLGADEALQTHFIQPFLDETFGPSEAEQTPVASTTTEEAPAASEQRGAEEEAGEALASGEGAAEEAAGEQGTPADTESTGAPAAGRQLRQVLDQVFTFVRGTNFTSLGTFSFVFLLYCVVKLLGATEKTLSIIWGVRTTRSFTRRLTNYLAIVVMTPMVVLTATGITALLEGSTYQVIRDRLGFDLRHEEVLAVLPFLVVAAGMTFLYMALPNTRVRVTSAMLGGVVGGFLWQLGQLAHVEFQLGVARMNAIYSGFAALPLFLLWLYVNWSVLLLGAEVAHAHQSEPLQTRLAATGDVDQRFRERLAVRLALRVVSAFQQGQRPPAVSTLAADLGLASRLVSEVLARLVEGELLLRTDEDSGEGFVPARNPDSITLLQVLEAMRTLPGSKEPPATRGLDERADAVLAAFRASVADSPYNESLAALARGSEERTGALEESGRTAVRSPG